MPLSKRSHEGILQIDHRDSPGLPAEMVHAAGLPVGAGRGVFEAPSYTCSHCCRVVVLNPLRTRDREYCSGCNRYICDQCGAIKAATGECVTFAEIVDQHIEAAMAQQ